MAPPGAVPPERRTGRATFAATIASIVLHVALGVGAAIAVARGLGDAAVGSTSASAFPAPRDSEPIVIDLPRSIGAAEPAATARPAAAAPAPTVPETPALAGGARIPRLDTHVAGRGGEVETSVPARNLATRADGDTVASDVRDDVSRDQENRLRTSDERRSQVDRRRALEPMQLTFVASGKGFLFERRPAAPTDATRGVASTPTPADVGGALGGAPQPATVPSVSNEGSNDAPPTSPVGVDRSGGDVASPPAGEAYGRASVGPPQSLGAAVTRARPHIDRGKPSVSADTKGSASDTKDSDLAVGGAMRSLVSTSTAGGVLGDGRGGSAAGGAPGAGGPTGEGSRSTAMADGAGRADGPRERRRIAYFLDLQRRLSPLVARSFPRDQEVELRSGTVIVDLTIAKRGSLVDIVVVRPSGFSEFDRNVVSAIRGAGLFEPVPDLLGSGPLTIRVPVHGGWHLQ